VDCGTALRQQFVESCRRNIKYSRTSQSSASINVIISGAGALGSILKPVKQLQLTRNTFAKIRA